MKLNVSASPHIRAPQSTRRIMGDVLLALLPAAAVGVYRFGYKALAVLALCAATAVFTEWLLHKLMKRDMTIGDLSAVVTGVLLGMNLPANAPWWLCVVGSAFAIGVVKVPFGGIGGNIVNPALAARAFLLASFPMAMTAWSAPVNSLVATVADTATGATPLAQLAQGQAGSDPVQVLVSLLVGNRSGSIGEVSAIALLIGFAYLLIRGVVSWRIPVVYLATVFAGAALAGAFGHTAYGPLWSGVLQAVSGGLVLGAVFMATDYTTSPVTPWGQVIYAAGCGVLTVVIRFLGSYPEGVSYSILIMNLCVPLIERFLRVRVYGEVKARA